jgi:hypothetical protein
MYCALLQKRRPPTNPHAGLRNEGFHNNSEIEERHTNEPGPNDDDIDAPGYGRPFSYTGSDLKKSSTPSPGPNLHYPATQQPYLQSHQPQYSYPQTSAPSNNYDWQAPNRKPVPSDLNGSNGAPPSFVFPRVDLKSPAARTDAKYNGPDGQRKASQLDRKESDRPPYRPSAPTTNPHR